jgi:hypothetical protein
VSVKSMWGTSDLSNVRFFTASISFRCSGMTLESFYKLLSFSAIQETLPGGCTLRWMRMTRVKMSIFNCNSPDLCSRAAQVADFTSSSRFN